MSESSTINVPSTYGYVILTCVVAPAVTSIIMGGVVMKARKAMNVPYPNLYATPGHHDKADAFNRVQRGHQSLFESISDFRSMALIGGLKHPLVCSASGLLFSVGYYFFQKGYADTNLEVATARYKKGGQIKWLGFFGVLGSCISAAGSVGGW
eukprot:CAMPEP_0116025564 /NCGR_PEP_ID=MMETSP0321-20121206/13146_1 /TAXON_ID=163516 /ORGANISM="Leptocylindrus danicus var. danicus, Strain B650" /LENGTH=152 /DNA_ID=CAMNT_0003497827 /DNA_START=39 /DNA_END=494 /DNA_ORIENTATION=-